jgi:hypothetical protein
VNYSSQFLPIAILNCGLAAELRHSLLGDGVHECVLDSCVPDPGGQWHGGLPGHAHYLKNVPGRKSDVSDCQWIQYLHSVGLLRASFRPPGVICAIRSLWRHRESLIQMAAEHVRHIQKALESNEPPEPPCAE